MTRCCRTPGCMTHLHVASAEQAEVLVVAAQLHPEVQLPAGGAVLAGALLQGEPLVVGLAVHVLHHRDAHLHAAARRRA